MTSTAGVQGAPCWVSLSTHDLRQAQDFYGTVLGWTFTAGFQGEENYCVAWAGEAPVAGLGAHSEPLGLPVAWTPHFVAASADLVADRIRERGATVAVGPIRFGKGRAAWAADPGGAVFGFWEGPVDPEWYVRRGPGAPAWLELRTQDPFASALFYGQVFDWDAPGPDDLDVRWEHDRVMVHIGGHAVAGLYGGGVDTAPHRHQRPQWHVYFCAADVDAAARTAADSGGRILAPPQDTPFGRTAAVRDPQGGLFHLASVETCPSP